MEKEKGNAEVKNEETKILIFISHRHEDKAIADVINEHLQDWGVDRDCIYQSSVNAQIGKGINQQILESIYHAKLVILVYTSDDENWSYCMWEAGVATDPRKEVRKIVVFLCTEDRPKPFSNQMSVTINKEKILSFTEQFYRDDNFFPGLGPFQENVTRKILKNKSDRLYNDLQSVIPQSPFKDIYRWDYLGLTLAKQSVTDIKEIKETEKCLKTIPEKCEVTKAKFSALRLFGFNELENNMTLKSLIDRWEEKVEGVDNTDRKWIEELCAGIIKVIP